MRDGRARISYVAFDSDDHLSRAQRTVRFTDYKKPSFSFTRGMEFRLSGNIDILKYIEAQDVFDGDISDKVKYSIESNAVSLGSVGEHQVTLRVTNSLGDTAHLPITVEVSSDEPNAAGIKLTQYVLYLNEGDEFDAISYVEGYTANDEYHAGADGLLIEVHNDPPHAKCDGQQSLTPEKFDALMKKVKTMVPMMGKSLVL